MRAMTLRFLVERISLRCSLSRFLISRFDIRSEEERTTRLIINPQHARFVKPTGQGKARIGP
ncbi:hypothetical protein BC567DRAFT_224508 [Phyllosticta citribraziliensis]